MMKFLGNAATCIGAACAIFGAGNAEAQQAPPVVAAAVEGGITMQNGIVSITVNKKSYLSSILYKHNGQTVAMGNHGFSMYFDSNAGAEGLPADVAAKAPKAGYQPMAEYCKSIQIVSSTPDAAEVVASGGPTTYLPFETDVHYIMKRGLSGFYTYVVFHHAPDMTAGGIGQTRFVIRGPKASTLYTDHVVDDARFGPIDRSPDVKAVSDATYLLQDGNVYCKYDNTAFLENHHVHGMTGHGVGIWMVNASEEYVNGGPIKQELTVHADNSLLNMLDGGHYGASGVHVDKGTDWRKVYGPFLVYINSGATTEEMFADAKRQTAVEVQAWPYKWVSDPDFPVVRGTVSGVLKLTDGESTAGAHVVLAAPGSDWTQQANGYEFWTTCAADGSFTIPKVRPGSYALYAYGANQFEQLEKDGVSVTSWRHN